LPFFFRSAERAYLSVVSKDNLYVGVHAARVVECRQVLCSVLSP
jgi:hypothetical protein